MKLRLKTREEIYQILRNLGFAETSKALSFCKNGSVYTFIKSKTWWEYCGREIGTIQDNVYGDEPPFNCPWIKTILGKSFPAIFFDEQLKVSLDKVLDDE